MSASDSTHTSNINESIQAESFGRSCVGKPGDRQAFTPTTPNLTPEGQRLRNVLVKHMGLTSTKDGLPHTIAALNAAALLLTAPEGEGAGLREADAPLARFDHHPDPSTDFCIEVEALQGWSVDMRAGRRSQWPFWGRLSRLLRFIKSPEFAALDEIAQRAKPIVLGLEQSAQERLPEAAALTPAVPKTPDADTGGSVGDGGLREAETEKWSVASGFPHTAESSAAWMDSAAMFSRNADFYRGIVVQIGEMFGDAAKTSDDGSLQDSVLALKVPGLVAAALAQPASVGEDEMGVREALTDALVDRFADALKAKLRASEAKYGWQNGWLKPDWQADCQRDLARHVAKGDPLDVAAYAAFCWHHGWSTAPQPPKAETPAGVGGARDKLRRAMCGDIADLLREGSAIRPYAFASHLLRPGTALATAVGLSTAPAARPGDEVERVKTQEGGR